MSRLTGFFAAVMTGLLVITAAAPVGAMTYDKLTYLTFSGPVRIPGVTLNAGTYSFRLANPDTSRNVVQVLSHDGSAVYAMFHTIPAYRSIATEEPTVTFREAPAGTPPEVRTLFYGGEHRGYEFVYGKHEPVIMRPDRPQPAVTFTYNPPPAAPIVAEPTPEPLPAEPVVAAVEPGEPPPAELPATATSLPWVALGGVVSLVLGLGVALISRHLA